MPHVRPPNAPSMTKMTYAEFGNPISSTAWGPAAEEMYIIDSNPIDVWKNNKHALQESMHEDITDIGT